MRVPGKSGTLPLGQSADAFDESVTITIIVERTTAEDKDNTAADDEREDLTDAETDDDGYHDEDHHDNVSAAPGVETGEEQIRPAAVESTVKFANARGVCVGGGGGDPIKSLAVKEESFSSESNEDDGTVVIRVEASTVSRTDCEL